MGARWDRGWLPRIFVRDRMVSRGVSISATRQFSHRRYALLVLLYPRRPRLDMDGRPATI